MSKQTVLIWHTPWGIEFPISPWMIGCAVLLFIGIVEAVLLYRMCRKQSGMKEKLALWETEILTQRDKAANENISDLKPENASGTVQHVGKLHNIGKRQSQQDSFGVTRVNSGIFAVVADGMGGLSDGDKVSQKIVRTMLEDASRIPAGQSGGCLFTMTAHVNAEVNQMLGPERLYQCGSTMIAVLADENCFQWVSVGDSRICLYRSGKLLQINREHIYETELLEKAVNHEITFAEAGRNSRRGSLTSFIGMGDLKYIDGSLRPAEVQRGDRILLMSDGVFRAVPEAEISAILRQYPEVEQAASVLENRVLAAQNPKQDNFTAVLISYD